MKLPISVLAGIFLLSANFSTSFADMEEDESYGLYNVLQINFDNVKNAETLHNEISKKLNDIEYFTKKGENAMVIISYDRYEPKMWGQVSDIIQKENLITMRKVLYLKDNEQGISDVYMFWLK